MLREAEHAEHSPLRSGDLHIDDRSWKWVLKSSSRLGKEPGIHALLDHDHRQPGASGVDTTTISASYF